MPGLKHNPDFERHMTLAALAHCPRDYWYVDRIRRGVDEEQPPNDSLLKGVLVHVGLGNLWKQRQADLTKPWLPSEALDAIDKAPEAAGRDNDNIKGYVTAAVVAEAKQAVAQYATQWTGVRDHWVPLQINPLGIPPAEWAMLYDEFVAYPDLIVQAAPLYPILVVDHKTSRFKFEAAKWEHCPELLTQCLAAKQLDVDSPIFYMVDYLQTPYQTKTSHSNVWSFPVTPVWEFTAEKEEVARLWIEHGLWQRDTYLMAYPRKIDAALPEVDWAAPDDLDQPWPQALSQCQTPWGLCKWYERCFGSGDA